MGRRRCGSPPWSCRSWRSGWTIAALRPDGLRRIRKSRSLEYAFASPLARAAALLPALVLGGGLPPQEPPAAYQPPPPLAPAATQHAEQAGAGVRRTEATPSDVGWDGASAPQPEPHGQAGVERGWAWRAGMGLRTPTAKAADGSIYDQNAMTAAHRDAADGLDCAGDESDQQPVGGGADYRSRAVCRWADYRSVAGRGEGDGCLPAGHGEGAGGGVCAAGWDPIRRESGACRLARFWIRPTRFS